MAEMNIIHEDRPSQFFVLSDGNNYQLKWDDSRLATHIKEIEKEDFEEYLAGKRTGGDLMFKAAYGTWPLPQEEQEKYYEEQGINDMLAKIKKESEQNWSGAKNE
ncbi:hypothetical protein Hs30E_20700 [Lactococcus hodotermopsidis]|uniref:Uncharacterized protein n=1 Tax=Pseudolactococcus hodotermopsidis TaxID=2709157 RepID=A0A6A0BDG4_9LACT|nr:hypothetical protein [Lactococcus hodotermopsidis]GFH43490.1 hypothetical protein Hs30E_20700 [Lactococcus hodotermopsidis]